jgi:proline dehydrogenase
LFLSRQPQLRRFVESSPFTQPMTRRFVAGQTLDECLAACESLRQQGILTTLDYLGENIRSLDEAAESLGHYLESMEQIQTRRIPSTVSIKLSQFGLELDQDACRANVRQLVSRARAAGTRVEIDMEDSTATTRTLDIVRALHEEFGCVRAVIQAYLRRSEADIRDLNSRSIPVRLCKGAYKEPAEVAFESKDEVNASYERLTRLLLEEGTDPAIATHDDRMVASALSVVRQRSVSPGQFEFQMLYGIRRDLQTRLVRDGFRVRAYVPYGNAWYPYFMRRLAERPANVWFVVKNLIRA